jgi:site-specific DNA-methyltransferase (adenine-specific)
MQNKIYYGDNLEVLRRYIKDESIDLCYIDPPFNSKRNYNQIYNNIGTEDKAQAQAFIDTWTWDDRANQGLAEIYGNYNGIFTVQSIDLITGLEKVLKKDSLLAYLVSMTLRIVEIHRVLKPTGSFYLHCDPTVSHYLKLVLDAVFCAKGGDFRNEIIWCYTFPGNFVKDFPKRHDVILRYAKSANLVFNREFLRIPYKAEFTAARGVHGEHGYAKDVQLKRHNRGKLPEDWWTEFSNVSQWRDELLGYPTQKPEALLERIIKASSNEGNTVLDAYCGCGTTIAVAERLNRYWIGIDITYQSISLILKRLNKQSKTALNDVELSGIPKDFASAIALANKQDDRLRKEFEKWLILTYSRNQAIVNDKKGGDGGVDGIAFIIHSNRLDNKKVLFSVKSSKVLSPVVIRELNGVVEHEHAACGILLTLYPMPNLVKESKQYGNYYNELVNSEFPKIQVISVNEVLNGELMNLPNAVDVLKAAELKIGKQFDLI